jgi:hypothetical protein
MTITTPLNDPNSSLVEGWTALWNGDLSQAATICAEQVTVHFGGRAIAEAGDHVMDASGLADLIGAFRSTRPGLTYRVVEAHSCSRKSIFSILHALAPVWAAGYLLPGPLLVARQ